MCLALGLPETPRGAVTILLAVCDVLSSGVQAQTAECLVVGEIATRHLCVVLNKIDLLPQDTRQRLIAKAKKRLAQTLAATTFAGCPMIAVSAKPGDYSCHVNSESCGVIIVFFSVSIASIVRMCRAAGLISSPSM